MLSQFDSNAAKEQKKVFLKALGDFPEGIMPIGRLDEKSEGLLLLTTDGKLSHEINSSGIEKEYYALVDGAITDDDILKLQNGVEISIVQENVQKQKCKYVLAQSSKQKTFLKTIILMKVS